jgi:hypothetical protein
MVASFYVAYELLGIVTFLMVDKKLSPDSSDVIEWKSNYKEGCGKDLDMTYALQNGCLNGVAYATVPVACYLVYLNKNKESNVQAQEGSTSIRGYFARLLVFASVCCLCAVPAMLITLETVGSPILVMVICIMIPSVLASYLLVGGPYDYIVSRLTSK